MRPELGLDLELEDEIERATQAGLRYGEWSQALRKLWRERTMHRRRRELAFINTLGLAWCIGCLPLDYIAGPRVFAAGLVLRLGLVVPLYVLAIAAAFYGGWRLQRWTTIAALPAFVGVAGYLGMHLVENEVQEYVMASGMLLAMSVVVLPLRVPWLALMSAVSALTLWVIWATMPGRGQAEFVLLCFISAIALANLSLPLRTSRLKDRAFLFDLRAQFVSQRLVEANALLWELSDRDELTGLPNRRHLERVLGPAFDESVRADTGLAVVMIDIDTSSSSTTPMAISQATRRWRRWPGCCRESSPGTARVLRASAGRNSSPSSKAPTNSPQWRLPTRRATRFPGVRSGAVAAAVRRLRSAWAWRCAVRATRHPPR